MLNYASITYLKTGIHDLPKADLRWSSLYGLWFVDWAGNIAWSNAWYNSWVWFQNFAAQWTYNFAAQWSGQHFPVRYTISAYLVQGPTFYHGVYDRGALKLAHSTNGGKLTVTGNLRLTRQGVD